MPNEMSKEDVKAPDLKPALTTENMHDHPDAPSDMLHSYVKSYLKMPKDEQEHHHSKMEDVAKHPNLSSETMRDYYQHAKGDKEDHILPIMMGHSSMPAGLAEDYLKNTMDSSDMDSDEGHKHAAKNPGVSREFLSDLADKTIADDKIKHDELSGDKFSHYNLGAEKYEKLLANRGSFEPETDQTSEKQKAQNNRYHKINKIALAGLPNTHDHTPESLQRAVEFYNKGHEDGESKHDFSHSRQEFIKNQKDLSGAQLEQMFQKPDDEDNYNYRDHNDEIFQHPNVSPSFLAKLAVEAADNRRGRSDSGKAISSAKLPPETKAKLIRKLNPSEVNSWSSNDSDVAHALLKNPTLTEDELVSLHNKGVHDAMYHEKAPPEMLRSYYNKSDKSTQPARSILHAAHVPEDVLTDIVSKHKNQDVAMEALKHPDVTMPVIEAALKRKAAKVQDAASRHPLVASKQILDRLANKKLKGSEFIHGNAAAEALKGLDEKNAPEIMSKLNDMYKDSSPGNMQSLNEQPDDYWKVKRFLATDKRVPEAIRAQNASHLISEYDSPTQARDVNSNVVQTVHDLANQGHPEAQAMVLTHPAQLQNLNISSPEYGADFQRQASQAINDPGHNPVGTDPNISANRVRRKIAKNDNTPDDVFEQNALNPDFLKDQSNYMHPGGQSWSRDNEIRHRTVFDKRWAGLSESERAAQFNKLTQAGGHKAVVESQDAPTNTWVNAFGRLNENDKADWIKNNDISEHGDDGLKQRAINGEFIYDPTLQTRGEAGNPHKAQLDALASLDATRPEHEHMLQEFFHNPRLNTDDPEKTIEAIPPEFWRGENGKRLAAMALASPNENVEQEGIRAAVKVATNIPNRAEAGKYLKEVMEIHRPEKFENQAQKDDLTAQRWAYAMQAIPNKSQSDTEQAGYRGRPVDKDSDMHQVGRFHDEPNGHLDFLASMPGNPEVTNEIRSLALKHGLVSKELRENLAVSKPNAMADAIAKTNNTHERGQIIRSVLDYNQVNDTLLEAIADHAQSNTFNPRSSVYSNQRNRDEADHDSTKQYMDKFIDKASASPNGWEYASKLLTKMATDTHTGREAGGMKEDQRKDLVKHFIDKVKSLGIPDDAKNKYLASVWGNFDQKSATGMLPRGFADGLAKEAVKNNQLDTLLSMAERGDKAPGIVIQHLSKIVEDPNALTNSQLMTVTGLLKAGATTPSTANRLVSAAQTRIRDTTDPKSALIMKNSLVNNMIDSMKSGHLSDTLLDHTLGYIHDPQIGQHVMDQLAPMLDGAFEDLVNQKKIFSAMPEDANIQIEKRTIYPSADFVNDPKMLQQAKDGWKLETMMNGVDNEGTDQNSLSLLTNRAMESQKLSEFAKTKFANHLAQNANASAEDVIKITRAIGPNQVFNSLKAMTHPSGSIQTPHAIPLLSLANQRLNEMAAESPAGTIPYGGVHTESLLKSARASVDAIQMIPHNIDEEQKEGFTKALDGLLDLHKSITDGGLANMAANKNSGLAMNSASILHHMTALSGMRHPLDSKQAMTALDVVHGTTRAAKEFGDSRDAVPVSSKGVGEFLTHWINKSGMEPGNWSQAYKKFPELQYSLYARQNIEPEALNGVDWPQFFKNPALSESDQQTFGMQFLGKMIGRLAPNAEHYAKEIIEHAIKHGIPENPSESNSLGLTEALTTAFRKSPSSFTNQDIHRMTPYAPNDMWNHIHEAAVYSGAGGKAFLGDMIEAALERDQGDYKVIKAMAKSPHLDDHLADGLLNVAEKKLGNVKGFGDKQIAYALADNVKTPASAISRIVNNLDQWVSPDDSEEGLETALTKHPNIDKQTFFDYYNKTKDKGYSTIFNTESKFHPALKNPKYGGDLFRSLPLQIPSEVKNVEPNNLITQAEYSVAKDRLQSAMQAIPAEGVTWANFKKSNQKLSNLPEVKQMFMKKNNKPVMPEDVVAAMKKHDAGAFHITYAKFDGAQRHRENYTQKGNPNLVMQLNTSAGMEAHLNKDPKLWSFFQLIQEAANHTHGNEIGGHPVTPHCASWVRVDTGGGKDGWIIEEFQSDFEKRLESEIATCKRDHPNGLQVNGHNFTVPEMENYQKQISSAIKGWHMASMSGMEELAKKQGLKYVYLHGPGVRAQLSGMQPSRKNPIWLDHMYNQAPEEAGWEKCEYNDYPVKSASFAKDLKASGRPTYCWRKKIT